MLRTLTIKNFKSIVDLTLELGRFNVFIGENGCGKSNILEALGMAAGAESARLSYEDLMLRGMRVAKPSMMCNAFRESTSTVIDIMTGWASGPEEVPYYVPCFLKDDGSRWRIPVRPLLAESVDSGNEASAGAFGTLSAGELAQVRARTLAVLQQDSTHGGMARQRLQAEEHLRAYAIYCASTLALRGLQVQSRHEPLGIYGEGLDVAIAQLPDALRAELLEHARMIAWLDDLEIDRGGARKLQGDKPGRSVSELYFADRFLSDERRVFSAENANEGILHVLFHLVLFLHPQGPRLLGIDNIETALNPHLLRHLVKALAGIAAAHDRQALVTTHNPAALDGLNLHDDEQRLFIVSRDDDGHTQARRVKVKPEHVVNGAKLKLSELWMRGLLGGIPTHF